MMSYYNYKQEKRVKFYDTTEVCTEVKGLKKQAQLEVTETKITSVIIRVNLSDVFWS